MPTFSSFFRKHYDITPSYILYRITSIHVLLVLTDRYNLIVYLRLWQQLRFFWRWFRRFHFVGSRRWKFGRLLFGRIFRLCPMSPPVFAHHDSWLCSVSNGKQSTCFSLGGWRKHKWINSTLQHLITGFGSNLVWRFECIFCCWSYIQNIPHVIAKSRSNSAGRIANKPVVLRPKSPTISFRMRFLNVFDREWEIVCLRAFRCCLSSTRPFKAAVVAQSNFSLSI